MPDRAITLDPRTPPHRRDAFEPAARHPRPVLAPWPGQTVALPSGRLHVRHASPGPRAASLAADRRTRLPTAVFVHGLGGSSTNWTGLMAALRDGAEGWAPDLPGFGESPPVRSGRHDLEAHVRALQEFVTGLGTPVHLVGNSMGGLVSLLLAARRPDLVATLSLISPAMPHVRQPSAARWLGLLALPVLGERLLASGSRRAVEEQVRRTTGVIYGDPAALAPEHLASAVAERRRRLAQPHGQAAFLDSLRSVVGHYARPARRSVWAAARSVAAPTLLVFGGRDRLVGRSTVDRWRATLPGARLAVLPTVGHVPMLERPDLVADLVRDQLRAR